MAAPPATSGRPNSWASDSSRVLSGARVNRSCPGSCGDRPSVCRISRQRLAWPSSSCASSVSGLPAGVAYYTGAPFYFGTMVSPEIRVASPMDHLIPSWQATTPAGTWLQMHVRVKLAAGWSGWYRLPIWSSDAATIKRHSVKLPSDATVAYARLYWSSTVREDMSPDSRVTLDRPGSSGFSQALYAGVNELQVADRSYQGTADVTALLQKYGAGVYRLSGAAKNELTDRYDDNNYVAWGIVVVYKRDADRIRSFSLWDGLTFVSPNNSSGIMVRGFVVPPDGPGESKLAVIGYEGDHDLTDDTLSVNGTRLGDGESGSETNFFNSTRTRLGQPQSVAGDLPQMSGGHDTSWWDQERGLYERFVHDHPRAPHPTLLSWETERIDRANRIQWLVVDALGPRPTDVPLVVEALAAPRSGAIVPSATGFTFVPTGGAGTERVALRVTSGTCAYQLAADLVIER